MFERLDHFNFYVRLKVIELLNDRKRNNNNYILIIFRENKKNKIEVQINETVTLLEITTIKKSTIRRYECLHVRNCFRMN